MSLQVIILEFMSDSLNAAANAHGESTVCSILQALQWSHVVKLESTRHGVFVKLLYRQPGDDVSRRKILLQSLIPPPQPLNAPPRPPYNYNAKDAVHEDESWENLLSQTSQTYY